MVDCPGLCRDAYPDDRKRWCAACAKPKKTPSQIGKMARRKGASFEREIADMLRDVWAGAKRGLGQARSAKEVCDVEGTPWWLELKCKQKPNIRAFGRVPREQRADFGHDAFRGLPAFDERRR